MRISALLVYALWIASAAPDACAEDNFPYTLIVTSETAEVLSGPGRTHYSTDRLPKGSKVQVYRHDPGGYVAIRPPENSFSLVLASAIQTTADPKVIEVKGSSVKAWVGSRLSGNFKPMWQVKLEQGELLNVIKKVVMKGATSAQTETWYQVEPPRGEFRWIHQDNLGPQAPATVSSALITDNQIARSNVEVDLLNQIGQARLESQIASTQRSGWKVLEFDQNRVANVSANEAFFDADFSAPSGFQSRLGSIELALSQMVLTPKRQWNLEALQASSDQLRREAATGTELAQANKLAQKIISFRKVKADSLGSNSLANERMASRGASLQAPNLGNPISQNRRAQYDGQGILRKLYVNGGIGPSIYALEDSTGKVTKTISPSSGVNLERFVGKPVGLFGKAGFNQKLNRPHLTAVRVVDLNRIR